MSEFNLSARSLSRLTGVHPDLQAVVMRAIQISPVDFAVLGGIRTQAEQRRLVAAGKSQTMNSRHLTGHAVDLGVYIAGQGVVWDWPLYRQLASAMKKAAKQKGVPIEWGGDWRTFKDGLHFQLPWAEYPAEAQVA
ncbi:MAG: peptidase M15 [Alphaproteobacteria bacterium]|nr:MAG: peptidase M15 [Alphaproteobacteria bacterium]